MGAGCDECCGAAGETPVVVTCGVSVGASAPRLGDSVKADTSGACAPVSYVALTTLKPGQTAVVRTTSLDAGDADLLRAMGLRLEARVRLCRLGEPCIVEVMGGGESCGRKGGCVCRIGLARPLAEKVLVGSVEGG